MKQTAVEWLEQFIEPDSKQLTTVLTILKEIEKQQIIDAYLEGGLGGDPDEYYNRTFKQEK
jgi:hypothetical protein